MATKATMKDIADYLDISITTVSHAINGTRLVSVELKEEIFKAIDKFGYKPNILARSLRMNKSFSIGLIVPQISNPFNAEVAHGVEKIAFNNNYNVILCSSERKLKKEMQYTDLLYNKQVDGIIFVGSWVGDQVQHIKEIQDKGMPVVLIDRSERDLEIDVVSADNEYGGYLATRHLIELGHKRIACIKGSPKATLNAKRPVGYKKAMKEAGIDDPIIKTSNFLFDGGYKVTKKLLQSKKPPTAIFACNDLMAIGVISAAYEMKRKIPEDISVVGFDNIGMSSYSTPSLTTIDYKIDEMGKKAAKILLNRISDNKIEYKHEYVEPKLVVRGTTSFHGGEN